MDNLDSWWDFDSGISIESNDDESEESTSLPIFLGLERHPSNARYVPSIPSVSEMDHGMVVVGALAVMSVMLVLLISVGLVVYMKILRRRTTTINLGNLSEVYQTTTEGQEQRILLQKNQIDGFQPFPDEKNQHLARFLQDV